MRAMLRIFTPLLASAALATPALAAEPDWALV